MDTSEEVMVHVERRGQSSVEYMLVISVLVIALVGALWAFQPRFFRGMRDFASGSKTAITDGSLAR
jgi:uncharacterized protein (UPF0333 family)